MSKRRAFSVIAFETKSASIRLVRAEQLAQQGQVPVLAGPEHLFQLRAQALHGLRVDARGRRAEHRLDRLDRLV
ncbi:hypothetical protein, partial [Paraburkholderia phenazinium]|uniref:hypothetical protein n=1 Tax=Paraburkholderia phenazinium TaxID=60549 RepID=UPI001ABC6845